MASASQEGKQPSTEEASEPKSGSGRGRGRRGSGSASGNAVEDLQEKAWQLFVVEVAEEGVRMMDSSDAQDLAERCFDAAEAFLKVRRRKSR